MSKSATPPERSPGMELCGRGEGEGEEGEGGACGHSEPQRQESSSQLLPTSQPATVRMRKASVVLLT